MYELFLLVSVFGILYFSLRKGFDYFSLAYFSAVLYFLPGFFGYASYHVAGVWRKLDLVDEAYAAMILVLGSVILFSLIFRVGDKSKIVDRTPPIRGLYLSVLFGLASIGLLGTLLSSGSELFVPQKAQVMDGLGRWHILYAAAITIGLPAAYLIKARVYCALFFLMLLFELYIGFRSPMAVSVLSVFTLHLTQSQKGRRLASQWKVVGLSAFFGLFLFSVKHILSVLKAGSFDVVVDRLSSLSFYVNAVVKSEPFVIQSTLNQVMAERFYTDWGHVLSVLNQFIVLSDQLGMEHRDFNGYFQSDLFPGVDYGMASNIWAQMWSAGGWGLLVLFVIFFNVGICLFNKTLYFRNTILRASLAPMACYWVFFIHRNDISYTVNLEKRLFIVLALALFFALLVYMAARGMRRDRAKSVVPA